jgi:uncharacterized protein YdaU (DUF1376 family)
MSGTPYIRFFGDDWLSGTQSLTLEERGVLITVVAMTATAGEAPAYDVDRLARRLGCTRAKTIRLMEALVLVGKITIEDGRIYQPRALKETKKAQENSEKQTKIANARWSRSDAKANENKPDADAMAMPRECQLEPEPELEVRKTTANAVVAHTVIEQPNPQKGKGKVRGASRGSRITESWAPTLKDYTFAAKHNLTREEINREADRFRNYWLAASGRGAAKCDWEAAWRNWLTGDHGIVTKRASASNASRNGSRTDAFDRLADRLQGGSDRADAWQHDDPATEGGYVIDVSPTRITG